MDNRDLLWPRQEEPEPGSNRTIYLDSPLSPQNSQHRCRLLSLPAECPGKGHPSVDPPSLGKQIC